MCRKKGPEPVFDFFSVKRCCNHHGLATELIADSTYRMLSMPPKLNYNPMDFSCKGRETPRPRMVDLDTNLTSLHGRTGPKVR